MRHEERSIFCAGFAALLLMTAAASGGDSTVLRIVEAVEAGSLQFTQTVSQFRYAFRIENTNQAAEKLQIDVAPLWGPSGASVRMEWKVEGRTNASVTVPELGAVDVEVTAALPQVGAYTGSLSFIYAGKRQTRGMRVIRARAAPSIEVQGFEAVGSVSLCTADAAFWLSVHETSGQEVKLNLPMFTSLTLAQANKSKLQAEYDEVSVTTEKGSPLTQPWLLSGSETKRLKLMVHGLTDPGEYTGTLRLAGPDSLPLDQAVTIFVKKSGLVAGALIFAGVFASYVIRLYAKSARPRLVRKQRLLALLTEIDRVRGPLAELTPSEENVLGNFCCRLNDVIEEVELGTDKNTDAVAEEIDRKLSLVPDWVNARRRVDAVQPAKLQRDLRKALEEVGQVLLKPVPSEEELKTATNTLAGFELKINEAVSAELLQQLTLFQTEMIQQRAVTKSDGLRLRLAQEVEGKIKTATDLVNAGQLSQARVVFDEARGTYARLLADDLALSLEGPRPIGFSDDKSWNDLKALVAQQITAARQARDTERAITSYRAAFGLYLGGLSRALQSHIEQRSKVVDASATLTADKKRDIKARLFALDSELDGAIKKVESGELREAGSDYASAEESLLAIVAEVATLGVQMGAAAAAQAVETNAGGTIPTATGAASTAVVPKRIPKAATAVAVLKRRLFWLDLLFSACVFVIAVFIGLNLLWADNPTWGGWKDCFSAALWGLGLHQVSGAAFEGVAGLTEKFGK